MKGLKELSYYNKTVAVIGAGAAGLIACGVIARRGINVKLFEKNNIVGKKLRITGKGRCNITNIADIDEFMGNVPSNGRFLYSAFSKFTNTDLITLLNNEGLETKVERGGRVFPKSDNAKDVVNALAKYALQDNVEFINQNVKEIVSADGRVNGVKISDRIIPADAVIVATGGVSYPLTGSTGDGYKFAQKAGHTIVEPVPGLVPLVVKQEWVAELMGLSLKNIAITLYNQNGKKVYTDFGEMLFTHFGLTGPVILSASMHITPPADGYSITIDLKPALSAQQLELRIRRDFEKNINKKVANSLDDLLPKKMIPVILKLWQVDTYKHVHQITKQERAMLVKLLKELKFDIKAFRPIDEAIISRGGVNIKEINPSTMESKLVKGLYFAGEVIDVSAYTGGYNLQIAFSTGHLAGMNVLRGDE